MTAFIKCSLFLLIYILFIGGVKMLDYIKCIFLKDYKEKFHYKYFFEYEYSIIKYCEVRLISKLNRDISIFELNNFLAVLDIFHYNLYDKFLFNNLNLYYKNGNLIFKELESENSLLFSNPFIDVVDLDKSIEESIDLLINYVYLSDDYNRSLYKKINEFLFYYKPFKNELIVPFIKKEWSFIFIKYEYNLFISD